MYSSISCPGLQAQDRCSEELCVEIGLLGFPLLVLSSTFVGPLKQQEVSGLWVSLAFMI